MHYLTKPQKSIYNMEKFTGGSIATICSSMLREGKIGCSVLQCAVNELYRLNDVLRTQIIETADGVMQKVSEYKNQDFEVLSFNEYSEFSRYAEKYAKEPIDIYGCLCDVKIVFVENSYGLLVKLHHIISDAWTMSLLARQFSNILDGISPEAYQYCEYIESEQEYVESKRYQKDKKFFLEQFKKCDEVTYLSDKLSEDYNADRKTFVLSKEQTNQIFDIAEKGDSSVFAVFMTLFGIYMSRIKMNTEKFYIGTPVLNRTGIKEQNIAGMFINTVPLLAEIDYYKTFEENLEATTDNIMAMLRHQHYNYEDLLAELRSQFNFTEKLYDVILSYQNAKTEAKDFKTEWHSCGMQTESLQIHIDDRDSNGILRINYDYRTDIFTEKEIEKINEHMFNLLDDAVNNKGKKVHELEILSNNEKHILLYDFNDTKSDYPKDKCVHQLFEEQVLKTPDKTAVIACDKTLTYDELNKLSNRIANNLIEKGVKANDIVAFALPRESSLIAVMFGILKSGAAYMPIDPNYPQDRVDFMLKDSNAKLFITESNLKQYVSSVNENPNINVVLTDYCYGIYTSGSTGKPKIVCINHSNFLCYLNNVKALYKSDEIVMPFFTNSNVDLTVTSIYLPIITGGCIYAYENDLSQTIEKIIYNEKINTIKMTPTHMSIMSSLEKYRKLDNIKYVIIGGENLSSDVVEEFLNKYGNHIQVHNEYGPTETTVGCMDYVYNKNDFDANVSIGKPIANTQICIVDKFMNLTPIGVIGELCIAGDGVGAGYLNRPELTAEKFIDNPFGEGKLYKTGDLAYWREDGNIAYVGRNDFQVKIRGLRIELGEIENAICSVEGVSQAVVVVRKDDNDRQLICAFYTEKQEVELAEIKKSILDKLPKYMMPHIFTVLPEMPLTPSGKINRKALPEIDLTNISNDVEYIQPQTEMQRALASIMEKVLNYSPIGLNDYFFDLGGDSLKAIEFVSKAHSEGIYFNLQDVFDNLTLEKLCEHIENNDKQSISFADIDFSNINKILSNNKIENISKLQRNEIGNILLAGATGFLGMHILSDFLDNDTGIAYCLVRGIDTKSAKKRFYELLHFYFGEKYDDCASMYSLRNL